MDHSEPNRGTEVSSNVVRHDDFQQIFATLVTCGGGHISFANGRGVCLVVSIREKNSEPQRRSAEIYLLRREASGQYTAFTYAPISDYDEKDTIQRYSSVVELWLCKAKISNTVFGALCMQVPCETDEIRLTNTGLAALREY